MGYVCRHGIKMLSGTVLMISIKGTKDDRHSVSSICKSILNKKNSGKLRYSNFLTQQKNSACRNAKYYRTPHHQSNCESNDSNDAQAKINILWRCPYFFVPQSRPSILRLECHFRVSRQWSVQWVMIILAFFFQTSKWSTHDDFGLNSNRNALHRGMLSFHVHQFPTFTLKSQTEHFKQ